MYTAEGRPSVSCHSALWEMARGLTLQQRAEVLGAPAGYEGHPSANSDVHGSMRCIVRIVPIESMKAMSSGILVRYIQNASEAGCVVEYRKSMPALSGSVRRSMSPRVR